MAMVCRRASGLMPSASARSRDMIMHTAAPSAWPEEDAGVMRPSGR